MFQLTGAIRLDFLTNVPITFSLDWFEYISLCQCQCQCQYLCYLYSLVKMDCDVLFYLV